MYVLRNQIIHLTHFIKWSGTDLAVSPRYTCIVSQSIYLKYLDWWWYNLLIRTDVFVPFQHFLKFSKKHWGKKLSFLSVFWLSGKSHRVNNSLEVLFHLIPHGSNKNSKITTRNIYSASYMLGTLLMKYINSFNPHKLIRDKSN